MSRACGDAAFNEVLTRWLCKECPFCFWFEMLQGDGGFEKQWILMLVEPQESS